MSKLFNAFVIAFTSFVIYFTTCMLIIDGYAVNPETKQVFLEPYKYLNNYLQMPVALIFLLAGVVLVLYGFGITWFKKSEKAIWFAGPGTVLTVLSIFFVLGYNNTSFYPSSVDLQSSLTIENVSSSLYTLTVMSYISLLVPLAAYIYYAWRAIDKHKIEPENVSADAEHYVY